MRAWIVLALVALAPAGCALSVPENYFGCSMDSQCPPGQFCNGDRCASQRSTIDASIDVGVHLDAGHDASADAAHPNDAPSAIDAASDVGQDVGVDASTDAYVVPVDTGTDAFVPVDAGHDAGHDASTWTASGSYSHSPQSSYVCAPRYDFTLTRWTFADNGVTLTVTDPNGDITCALTGTTASATGAFDVGCAEVVNGCTGTFRLMGAFTGNDTWTATFGVTFTGTCGAAPDTCTAQTFPSVTGMRL